MKICGIKKGKIPFVSQYANLYYKNVFIPLSHYFQNKNVIVILLNIKNIWDFMNIIRAFS